MAMKALSAMTVRAWISSQAESKNWPWFSIIALPIITLFSYWRLIDQGLADHLFDFGKEGLNAVQAWENHGFWSMAGMFPWGQGYLPANTEVAHLYQSKTPLHLFPLWVAYKLAGSNGYPALKIAYSLALASINGLLLAGIARLCFQTFSEGIKKSILNQLVVISTYALVITNESVLRFCMIDEPDYLAITFWLATILSLGIWLRKAETKKIPFLSLVLGFLTSWIYPIFGVANLITFAALQLFRLDGRLKHALRALIPGSALGIGLYWIQRLIAKLLLPEKLYGSELMYRMGLVKDPASHKGFFDAIDFIYDQKSGGIPGRLLDSQIYIEHCVIWIIGIVLFFIVLAKLKGIERQTLLTLAAGGAWMLVPLLNQSLSQHGWVYGIHFMPAVVLGWIGALTTVLPGKKSALFGPGMLIFISLVIWAIQLRWFMVLYLN